MGGGPEDRAASGAARRGGARRGRRPERRLGERGERLESTGVLEMAAAVRVRAARGFARPAARGPAADDRAGDPPGGHRARHRDPAWGPHALDPAAARPGRRDQPGERQPGAERGRSEAAQDRLLVRPQPRSRVRRQAGRDRRPLPRPTERRPGALGRRETSLAPRADLGGRPGAGRTAPNPSCRCAPAGRAASPPPTSASAPLVSWPP